MIVNHVYTVVRSVIFVVLNKGCISEEGSHNELLTSDGLYARMWADYNKAVQWKISSEKEAR